jgi:membrane protein required for colicin V production
VIDIIFCIVVGLAIIRGWRKGLIVALFSFVCCLLGLAAAVKLSAVVAAHLGSGLQASGRWLPIIAFILVFLAVAILVSLLGRLLEKLISVVFLGWLNKLFGILLFLILYISVYSVILFYGTRTNLISPEARAASRIYPLIASWGPRVIHFIARFIPFGQDMFAALESFFDKIGRRIR